MNMGNQPVPHVDAIEYGRPFEQPTARFGAEHVVHEVIAVPEVEEVTLLTSEVYNPDDVLHALNYCAANDVETFGVSQMSDPEFAVQKAIEAYDIYACDTDFTPEPAVAEYLAGLATVLIESTTASPADVESMFAGITEHLKKVDKYVAAMSS